MKHFLFAIAVTLLALSCATAACADASDALPNYSHYAWQSPDEIATDEGGTASLFTDVSAGDVNGFSVYLSEFGFAEKGNIEMDDGGFATLFENDEVTIFTVYYADEEIFLTYHPQGYALLKPSADWAEQDDGKASPITTTAPTRAPSPGANPGIGIGGYPAGVSGDIYERQSTPCFAYGCEGGKITCTICDGTGRIEKRQSVFTYGTYGTPDYITVETICNWCGGDGYRECIYCDGDGMID